MTTTGLYGRNVIVAGATGGILGFTRPLTVLCRSKGIRVHAIASSDFVDTEGHAPAFPTKRMGDLGRIAVHE